MVGVLIIKKIMGKEWMATGAFLHDSYIANTVIFLVTMGFLLYRDRKLLKYLAAFVIPVFLTGLPLAVMIGINQWDLPQIEIGKITIPRFLRYHGSEFVLDIGLIWENLKTLFVSVLTRDWIDYNAFDRYYTMYPVSIPFIGIGFISLLFRSIRNIRKEK